MSKVTVEQWTEMFSDIGLTEDTMHKWHCTFERKYPDGHQEFLEWLGIDGTRIKEIRSKCK